MAAIMPIPHTDTAHVCLYEEGNIDKMIRKAVEDCKTLQANGADGCLIQTVDVSGL